MASPLHLQVLTPAETLLEAESVQWVHLRLADGTGITVYPGHAPLLAETVTAPLRYADAAGDHTFHAEGGILQVKDAEVKVFTSGRAERIEPSAVAEERQFARLVRALQGKLEREPSDLLGRDVEQK